MAVVPYVPRYVKPAMGTLNIKRKFWLGLWAPNTTSVSGYWRPQFLRLDQIPNYTELTALFDQYKINAVKLEFIANHTGADANGALAGGNYQIPRVHVCYDKFSTSTPTGLYGSGAFNTFMEQGRVKNIRDPLKPFSIFVRKPTIARWDAAIAGGNTNLGYAPYLRTDNSDMVEHNLCNIFISDTNFTGLDLPSWKWDIYVTAYLSFRNQK